MKNKTVFHIFLLSYLFYVWYIHPLAYCVFICSLFSNSIHPVDEEPHRKVSPQKINLTIYLYPFLPLVLTIILTCQGPDLVQDKSMWDLLSTKWHLGWFPLGILVFPCQDNSTNTVVYNYSLACHRQFTALTIDGVCK